jgi:predicted phosphodiesterase
MKIQVFSDLHLEFRKNYLFPKIKPLADYLFLAGDIGKLNIPNYQQFFDYCSKNWKHTICILGNHEYYHCTKSIFELKTEYQNFFKQFDNISLLDNEYIYLNSDIVVYGTTLWTYPSQESLRRINDFHCILETPTKTLELKTLENICDIEHESLKKFNQEFANKNIYKILITHFPIVQTNVSHPKYNIQPLYLKNYFSSNFFHQLEYPIDLIISGHTHYSYDFKINSTRFISNQIGYPGETILNFSMNGLFHI